MSAATHRVISSAQANVIDAVTWADPAGGVFRGIAPLAINDLSSRRGPLDRNNEKHLFACAGNLYRVVHVI